MASSAVAKVASSANIAEVAPSADLAEVASSADLACVTYHNLVLSDLGILVAAGVHFDVYGPVLCPGGDSVRARSYLVAGDPSDGDQLSVTTAMRPLTRGFVCCVVGCNS